MTIRAAGTTTSSRRPCTATATGSGCRPSWSAPTPAGSSLRLADSPHDLVGGQVVSTLPAVAGYPVAVDGVTHVTDQQGRVALPRSAAVGPPLSGRISTGTATITQDGRPVAVRTSKV